ncbi:MAG: hypothetical protein L0Z50_26100, partial [Verrucomicrobiales bacterium]|nr:hypothetical protein [Verrucomicrobiales bacterium]
MVIRKLTVQAAFLLAVAFLTAGRSEDGLASAGEALENGDKTIQDSWVAPVVLDRNGQPMKLQVD